MSRRRAVSAAVAAAIVVSAGSSRPAAAGDDAATVNGESISVEEFEDAVAGLGASGVTSPVSGGIVAAGDGRSILSVMILNVLRGQYLAARGDEPLASDAVESQAAQLDERQAGASAEPVTGAARDLLATHFAYGERFAELEPPDTDELAAMHADSPASVGVICLEVVTVVGDAEAAAAALRNGDAIEDVVAAAGDGSRAQDECLSLAELRMAVPGRFDEITALGPGGVLDPIATPTGSQILQIAAFDDIAGELEEYLADPPVSPASGQPQTIGDLLLSGYALTADVTVSPRYGRWDPATASIVPLGQP